MKKNKFTPEQEQAIISIVIDSEYETSKSNNDVDNADFESAIDMLEARRTEKDYDWMSDVFIPEFPSMVLTDASQWATQYFQSRDFVDIYLEGDKPDDKAKTRAAKKLINKTLNNSEIHHYHKYIRARIANALGGSVVAKCWWEYEEKDKYLGKRMVEKALDVDEFGNKIVDPLNQRAARVNVEEDHYEKEVVFDRFNYDVVEMRNVFTDNKYVYSLQDKDFVILRSEMTYEELVEMQERNGYFNLDKLIDKPKHDETETSQQTYNKDDRHAKADKTPIKPCDILERFGKFWCKVEETFPDGYPKRVSPGIDSDGKPMRDAVLIETIITHAISGSQKVLIRFQATPFRTPKGKPYRPLIRGLCYIHPTKDTGLSSAKYLRELQVAVNDTFNISQDRVKLATLPVFKGRKYSIEDNNEIYMEPEHVIPLDNPDDLVELQIKDNPVGAIRQMGMLVSSMQQVEAIFPTTMGALPESASTSATAVAGAESKGNNRANYKSLTFEYTFLVPFYTMILWQAYQFMKPETALEVMGDDAYHFDPNADYTYQPVTSNIESEHNKYRKVQQLDQMMGRLAGLAQGVPEIMPVIAHILGMQLEAQGAEYQDIAKMLDAVSKAKFQGNDQQQQGAAPTTANQIPSMPNIPMQNQMGMEQTGMEQMVRGDMNE